MIMTNPKLEKVKAGIEKMKAKINEYQGKLRDLEREKIRLENEEIVALVRGEKISDAELNALMQSLRRENVGTSPITTGDTIASTLEDDYDDEN